MPTSRYKNSQKRGTENDQTQRGKKKKKEKKTGGESVENKHAKCLSELGLQFIMHCRRSFKGDGKGLNPIDAAHTVLLVYMEDVIEKKNFFSIIK